MSKKTTILSIGYWFSATTLGMLIHPYKTMREVSRNKSLRLSVLSPAVWVGIFWAVAAVIVLMARLLVSTQGITYPRWLYAGSEYLFWWVMWFLGLWQALMGYLFLRFWKAFRK